MIKKKKVKIQKIGNSFMVSIPKEIRDKAGLKVKDVALVEYSSGSIIVKPLKKSSKKITKKDWLTLSVSAPTKRNIPWQDIKKGFHERISIHR